MVYAEFGRQTECIMGNSKIENGDFKQDLSRLPEVELSPYMSFLLFLFCFAK